MPLCDLCYGAGELFVHAVNCYSDDCALAGGIDDCEGFVEACPNCDPDYLFTAASPPQANSITTDGDAGLMRKVTLRD